jgi:release factor glutamine methyltransferase
VHHSHAFHGETIDVADVGTGSGIIAVCAAKYCPAIHATAIDVSTGALAVARRNAKKHGVADRVALVESDLLTGIPDGRRFDFVVSNPPYIGEREFEDLDRQVRDYEPRVALAAGPDGTAVIDRLIAQAAGRLKPGGGLFIEISPFIHECIVARIESDPHFAAPETIPDLARIPRVVKTWLR